jgi:lipopolysaccharide biosynthesis regulator YciM
MINATLMDQQNRDVNRRSLIGNTSEIYRSDQEYRRAIETAKIALQKAQDKSKSPDYRDSVSIDVIKYIDEAATKLMEANKDMTREQALAQARKDLAESSNVGRVAGVGLSSMKTGNDEGPVALELRPGQQ